MRNILRNFILTVMVLVMGLMVFTGCQTQQEAEGEDQTKVLRVGMECAYAPYNWAQADNSYAYSELPEIGTAPFELSACAQLYGA